MNSETTFLIEDFPWQNYLLRATGTIYFHVSAFHPATSWQDCYGGDICLTGLSVDSALLVDDTGAEREAGPGERYAIGRAVMAEKFDWLIEQCAESVA